MYSTNTCLIVTNVYFQRENFILCQLYFKDIAFVKSKCCERKREGREERKRKERKRGLQLALSLMSEDSGVKDITCVLQIASHLPGHQRSFLDESPPSPNPCRRQVRAGAQASKDPGGPPKSAGSDGTPRRPFLATRSISCRVSTGGKRGSTLHGTAWDPHGTSPGTSTVVAYTEGLFGFSGLPFPPPHY